MYSLFADSRVFILCISDQLESCEINMMSQPFGVMPVFSFIPKKCLQSFCGGGVATIVVGPSGLRALSQN